MNKFFAPADHLVQETRSYIDAQIDNVKLRSMKGLSQGTSAIAGLLLIFIFVGALVTALSFTVVLWLGELLHSYALAAFIMSGVLLLALLLLIVFRKSLFKDSFVSMYSDVFYQKESKPLGLKGQDDLDEAISRTESRIKKGAANISGDFAKVKQFYSPKKLLSDGLLAIAARLLSKKKKPN